MNSLEFKEVMRAVGINNPLSTTTGRCGSREDVHYWNNLAIWFGGSYYTVVNGFIPYEVASTIYRKYPKNQYKIRVNGGGEDWRPISHATDRIYEDEISEYREQDLSYEELTEKFMNAKKRLQRRGRENKYLKTYHIDTKEGLLIFFTEMKDYYLRKNNQPETEVNKYEDLLLQVNKRILNKVNPAITAYDWMQGDEDNKANYNKALERDKKTEAGEYFRETVDDFDRAVNPFLNRDLELDDIENYLRRVNIKGNIYDYKDDKYRRGCCDFEITDPKTGNKTCYYRTPEGFSFQLHYELGDEEYLHVLHYYTTIGNYESDKGEVIAINYFGKDLNDSIDLRFNITNGKAGKTYEEKKPITPDEVDFIFEELLKAIDYAKSITVDNMKKPSNAKRLK